MTVCVYVSSLIQSAYFLSLFKLVSLLSKQFNAFKGRGRVLDCRLKGPRFDPRPGHEIFFKSP